MWASLLSSAGALVDLQAPCLTDTVLVQVVDYIYSGALPHPHDQQECYDLLTAASYLQMDGLLETLRSKVKPADNASSSAVRREDQSCKQDNSSEVSMEDMCQQLSSTCNVKPPQREGRYADDIGVCGASERCNCCENADLNVSCATTGDCGQVHDRTPCNLTQSISSTAGWRRASREDNEVWEDRFHSADSWQMSRDELAQKAETEKSLYVLLGGKARQGETSKEDRTLTWALRDTRHAKDMKKARNSLDTSYHHGLKDNVPPLPRLRPCLQTSHPCSGAVPVIRHSSTVEDVPSLTSQHLPATQSSGGCSEASPAGSPDYGYNADGITCELQNQPEAQDRDDVNGQDRRCCTMEASAQTANKKELYKPHRQEYSCCSRDGARHWDRFGVTDEHVHRCDSSQSHTQHLRTDSMAPNKDKDEQLHCSDCHSVLMVAATENQSARSPDAQSAVPLPAQQRGTGNASDCEECGPEREMREELGDTQRSPADSYEQHSRCHRFSAWNECYANSHGAEKSFSNSACIQFAEKHVDTPVDAGPARGSLEHGNISEESSTFTMSNDRSCDVDPGFVGHSYRGHLHYHCLSQEDPRSDPPHSFSPHPKPSSQSGDEHEDGMIPHRALSPLRQHLASAEKIVLLDISTKPAELLVSYKPNKTEAWLGFAQKDTSGNGNAPREPTGQGGEGQNKASGSQNTEDRPSVLTLCSSPGVPDYVEASISPPLSVCIPSAMPVSAPTNVSEQLSARLHHPFQCSMCERSFSQRGSLNRHVRSHLGIRPFPCPRCPMTFSRQYRVTEHMRVHQRFVLQHDFPKPSAPPI